MNLTIRGKTLFLRNSHNIHAFLQLHLRRAQKRLHRTNIHYLLCKIRSQTLHVDAFSQLFS